MHIHILVKISKQVSEVKSSWRRLVWESSCGAFCCSGQCDASAAGLWRCSVRGQCCSLKCGQSVKRCSAQCTLESVHWQSAFFFKNSSLPKCTVCTVSSAQCLLLCLSVQFTVHTCTAHSAQCAVQSTKCTVCSSSTAMQAQQLSSLWRAELHCILSPLYPLLHTFHCRGGGNFVCWAIKSWEET